MLCPPITTPTFYIVTFLEPAHETIFIYNSEPLTHIYILSF